uniref:uncharacterized protein LOC109954473 isoform X2 n=1 Tax=Monopterus albus TaxID=43700 RepID=UPI0009B40C3B|nr:uncharacterized protein LOC109954473 isoform X2 [Monopterus albus]
MEVAPCVQEVSSHIASLLTSLNLQREQAQFCDCVVRQSQTPGQLYHAHKCVLAASSPVLASMLSSAGVLVELQAPCLSGSVLALLLDYIYKGTLPNACSQQQYHSLLTAACYLQMHELQEALCTWQQTEVSDADKTNASTGTENQPYEDIITDFRKLEGTDTCTVQSTAKSPKRQYSAIVETYGEPQMDSASTDPHIKEEETDACGASSINGADCCSRKDASTRSTCCNTPEGGDNCRQVTHLTPHSLIQNILSTTEVHSMSTVVKELQRDQFHSAGTVNTETWQKSRQVELMRTVEDRRSSSLSSSSSAHPCCGAVPVICHSRRSALIQLAEESTMPAYQSVSQASINSSRPPVSQSTSADNESVVDSSTTTQKNHPRVENLDYRNNKEHTGTPRRDYKNRSNQCARHDLHYKSNTDQSGMLKQDYNSSSSDHLVKVNDERTGNGIARAADHNEHQPPCDSFQDKNHTKNFRGYSVCSGFIRRLKTDFSCDDLPSKRQRLDCSDCQDVSASAVAEEHAQDLRTVGPLPAEDSDTRSDSPCEDLCPEGQAKEEHSYSSKCPAQIDGQNSHCSLYGPKTDWYPKLHRAETSTKDAASSQSHWDSGNRDTATEGRRHGADVCPFLSNTPESSLDNVTEGFSERCTDTETTVPHFKFTIPADSNILDPMCSAVGQSYRGHLHYHCLHQEDTHLSRGHSDHKRSHASCPDHGDQSSDEEEAGTFASPGHSPLRQHFATGTDQVLLLDISTKPVELLMSYKHRSDQEEKAVVFNKNDTFGTGIRNNNSKERNAETSVAAVDKRKTRAETTFGAKSVAETESWVRETNVEERKLRGKDQSNLGAETINKTGVLEVSSYQEDENQASALTACTLLSIPGSLQSTMSSPLSVCIPSTLSASMPTNISAHLSSPVHQPFQCSLCERSFSQRGSLNRHVRSHLGVRPFPCPRCPMTFSRQYRVTEHMRVHQRCTLGNDFHKPYIN